MFRGKKLDVSSLMDTCFCNIDIISGARVAHFSYLMSYLSIFTKEKGMIDLARHFSRSKARMPFTQTSCMPCKIYEKFVGHS